MSHDRNHIEINAIHSMNEHDRLSLCGMHNTAECAAHHDKHNKHNLGVTTTHLRVKGVTEKKVTRKFTGQRVDKRSTKKKIVFL